MSDPYKGEIKIQICYFQKGFKITYRAPGKLFHNIMILYMPKGKGRYLSLDAFCGRLVGFVISVIYLTIRLLV